MPQAEALACQFNGGDDYELCFTLDAQRRGDLARALDAVPVPVTEIGVITADKGIVCQPDDGPAYAVSASGFDHFAGENDD